MIKSILFFSSMFAGISMYCMEEQKVLRPMPPLEREEGPSEYTQQKFVILELVDKDDKVLYKIQIPYAFAQRASVLNNLLAFQEEEEDREVTLPISAESLSIDQLKVLEQVAHQTLLQQGSIKKSVKALAQQWYPNNLKNIIDLIIVSNYIGHENLLKYSLKNLQKVLQQLAAGDKWEIVFQLGQMIKISELQKELVSLSIQVHEIKNLINKLYSQKIQQEVTYEAIIKNPASSTIRISNLKWLAIEFKSREKVLKIIDLEGKTIISEFTVQADPFDDLRHHYPMDLFLTKPWVAVQKTSKINIYDIYTGALIKSIGLGNNAEIFSICSSHDGSLIAVNAFIESQVKIYIIDTNTRELKYEIPRKMEHLARVLAFSPDAQLLAFEQNKKIIVWNIKENSLFKTLQGHKEYVSSLTFSPNGKLLVSASMDSTIKIWDIASGNEIRALVGDNSGKKYISTYLSTLDISSDGLFLASGFTDYEPRVKSDRAVKIWNLQDGSLVTAIKGEHHSIFSVSFSPDVSSIAYVAKRNLQDRQGVLRVVSINIPNVLKDLSLPPVLLLWNFAVQEQKGLPVSIPRGYEDYFNVLPEKIRDYFYYRNIELGGQMLPIKMEIEKSPIQFLKEKRKGREEKAKKKKQRPFKRFKRRETLKQND